MASHTRTNISHKKPDNGVGAAASGRKLRLRGEFTFARCAVGRLREGLGEFFLPRYTRGGGKRSETAIARIYVRSLCRTLA